MSYIKLLRSVNKHNLFYFSVKHAMIVTEYMENGALDTFLKVKLLFERRFKLRVNHSSPWFLYLTSPFSFLI